ncbi:hypothetical protein [Novosphingobium sp. YAF33]|jgi:hypothetical protein|uniref:hypothetical protein n=1 Tax=Novosphingobium sp. YAF33 TaxID=3233082 RepID=UPI003F9E7EF9
MTVIVGLEEHGVFATTGSTSLSPEQQPQYSGSTIVVAKLPRLHGQSVDARSVSPLRNDRKEERLR